VPMSELANYQRVVIDQDTCISCGACVAACPYQAIELDENGKSRLIWEMCKDDFSCIAVCPVKCIYKTSEAPAEFKAKKGWYKFGKALSPEEQKVYEEWKSKYGVTAPPV
jgi:ferredoxin